MSFFKNIFGSKENNEQKADAKEEGIQSYENIPWMTDLRRETLAICLNAGFKPASSLPTEFDKQLRTATEIAKRLSAIKAIVLWLMVAQEDLPSEKILNFVSENELNEFMADDEKAILSLSRNDEEARNIIGWKFENAWPLAWYFGYKVPDITGEMMSGDQMQDILTNYSCPLNENVEEWISNKNTITEEEIGKKEDLFYCLHNAVRSAQLGSDTVPNGFHPVGNGGVIHERRHSLTWMLSKGTTWDETDLST